MLTVEGIFDRADEVVLGELLGSKTLQILSCFDSEISNLQNLKEKILFLDIPVGELLLDKNFRKNLIDLLRKDEVLEICRFLEIKELNPYEQLKQLKYSVKSNSYKRLCEYFGVEKKTEEVNDSRNAEQEIIPNKGLFDHQINAVNEVLEKLARDGKKVLLHMPTGSGKTRTAMNVVCDYFKRYRGTSIIWLAYSEELCDQAFDEFESTWKSTGNYNIKAYRFYSNFNFNEEDTNSGFIVAGLDKLYQKILNDMSFAAKIGQKLNLLVFDEAHQIVADTYRKTVDAITNVKDIPVLGLSATPGRTWNDTDIDEPLSKYFNRQRVTLNITGYQNPIDYLVQNGYLARTTFRSILGMNIILSADEKTEIANSFDLPQKYLERLATDQQRNLLIIKELLLLSQKHQRILFFGASVEHTKVIAGVLKAKRIRSALVLGTTPNSERRRIINDYKIAGGNPYILCNFGVLKMGFDAPATSAALIARPTKSLVLFSQMVGRATRGNRVGGNEAAEIVTVVDTGLPGFRDMGEAFTNWEDIWEDNDA